MAVSLPAYGRDANYPVTLHTPYTRDDPLPHGMEIKHRWLCLCQLYGGDADSPDVALLVVTPFLLHSGHLGGHPVRGPDERFPLHQQRLCQLSSDTKVSCTEKKPLIYK